MPIQDDDEQDRYWRGLHTKSPEEAAEYYRKADTFIRDYYSHVFNLDEYVLATREVHEATLNLLQFYLKNVWLRSDISLESKLYVTVIVTQMIFDIGYREGTHRDDPQPDLPRGFYEALEGL